MNIFATHRNPIKAANWLWDLDKVRGRKMIVESAQLLSYWAWKCNPKLAEKEYSNGNIYKYVKGYVNGRFVSWLAESMENVVWLYRYGVELIRLYGKPHKSNKVYVALAEEFISFDLVDQLTPFVYYAQAKSKPEFSVYEKDCKNVHKAYRKYLFNQVCVPKIDCSHVQNKGNLA